VIFLKKFIVSPLIEKFWHVKSRSLVGRRQCFEGTAASILRVEEQAMWGIAVFDVGRGGKNWGLERTNWSGVIESGPLKESLTRIKERKEKIRKVKEAGL
jgi:hypothetical protein